MKEKIFEIVFRNLKNPKLYGVILTLFIIIIFIFPYLDANIFYYKRINDRVDIITKVSSLDVKTIYNNPILKNEYESILSEISNQPESMLTNMFTKETKTETKVAKFIAGGLLMWIIAIICLFYKGFPNYGYRIFAFLLLAIAGCILGFVFKQMPNFISPWVNCISSPILELIILALFLTSSKNKSEKDNKG